MLFRSRDQRPLGKHLRIGQGMPSVGLSLSDPQVTFSHDEYGGRQGWRISFEAKIANGYHQKVELTTEEGDLEILKGMVGFESTTKEAYMSFQKGTLSYWKWFDDTIDPMPANYLASLRMDDEDLDRLMSTISAGIPLLSINVELSFDDIDTGWEPDGSHKKWDNRTKPKIEIQGYRLFFGKPEEEEVEQDPPESSIDTDIKLLESVRETNRLTRYVLYALLALIVAVVIR